MILDMKYQLDSCGWGYSSVVEHLTADQEVPGSSPGAPLFSSLTEPTLGLIFQERVFGGKGEKREINKELERWMLGKQTQQMSTRGSEQIET